jgi:hypothetical protein
MKFWNDFIVLYSHSDPDPGVVEHAAHIIPWAAFSRHGMAAANYCPAISV